MAKEFYDDLAESYHLIFQDWEASLRYQADVLARLLPPPGLDVPILDCACGIGTQAIGLALKGYRIEGRDPSPTSIGRGVVKPPYEVSQQISVLMTCAISQPSVGRLRSCYCHGQRDSPPSERCGHPCRTFVHAGPLAHEWGSPDQPARLRPVTGGTSHWHARFILSGWDVSSNCSPSMGLGG